LEYPSGGQRDASGVMEIVWRVPDRILDPRGDELRVLLLFSAMMTAAPAAARAADSAADAIVDGRDLLRGVEPKPSTWYSRISARRGEHQLARAARPSSQRRPTRCGAVGEAVGAKHDRKLPSGLGVGRRRRGSHQPSVPA
jgi:hypothetical protein